MRSRVARSIGLLLSLLSLAILVSCSSDGGDSILDPGPGPTPPGDDEGFFVSAATGHDDSAGTKARPLKTIKRAILAAAPSGKDVFVAQGSYEETTPAGALDMQSRVSLFGGYNGTTWQRNPAQYVTEITSDALYPTIVCSGADSFTIDGFTIRSPGPSAADIVSAASTVCIYIAGVSSGVVISNNILVAGFGGKGANGASNVVGSGAGNGGNGSGPGICTAGGGGISAAGFPGGPGGAGGNFAGFAGSNATDSDAIYGGGGAGGSSPLDAAGKHGGDGRDGTNGTHGQAGASLGTFTSIGYIPAAGTDGTPGTSGRGGGGGGGAYGNGLSCGAGGGGGGGGGRGGGRGTHGEGGAGSFGILISGQCTVEITNNQITVGNGGIGGNAGEGASGGGGSKGFGGTQALFASGGNGGDGGVGGNGGHGGPGGGGPSIGIAEGPLDATVRTGNTITLGAPGAGGTTVAAGQPNAPSGVAQDYLKFN